MIKTWKRWSKTQESATNLNISFFKEIMLNNPYLAGYGKNNVMWQLVENSFNVHIAFGRPGYPVASSAIFLDIEMML